MPAIEDADLVQNTADCDIFTPDCDTFRNYNLKAEPLFDRKPIMFLNWLRLYGVCTNYRFEYTATYCGRLHHWGKFLMCKTLLLIKLAIF